MLATVAVGEVSILKHGRSIVLKTEMCMLVPLKLLWKKEKSSMKRVHIVVVATTKLMEKLHLVDLVGSEMAKKRGVDGMLFGKGRVVINGKTVIAMVESDFLC
ncbi:hypothetical protein Lser_V15G25858 [Lactuca serriola]